MPTIQESVDALVVETTGLTNTVSGRITDMTNKVAAADLAKGAAENAKSGAEIAQSGAETAETAANTAKTLAQTAKTNAETASTSATTASTNAGTSESNASSSATASENSAIAAASSATAASTDASTATTKASDASTSETNASTDASTAATRASEASTSASNAASAEAGASTSETNASTSASIASTKASDASSSATAASTSETNASSSASSASTSDTNASSSATAAAGSASTAASTLSNRYTKSETDAKIVSLSPPATKSHVDSLGIDAGTLTGALPAISGSNLTGNEARRFHVQSFKDLGGEVVIYPAEMIGSTYTFGADESQSVIDVDNPYEMVDGYAMATAAIVGNPHEKWMAANGTSDGWSPSTSRGACYYDFPIKKMGIDMGYSGYKSHSSKVTSTMNTGGKNGHIMMFVSVEGSPHRAHRTYIQMSSQHLGAHNSAMWWEVSSPTAPQRARARVGGHQGRFNIENISNAGTNASAGSAYRNQGVYAVNASGYGGVGGYPNYGSWVSVPYGNHLGYPNLRIWNWGYGALTIHAIGVAYGET